MKLVVHIGSHKTGSTSIQWYAYHHHDALVADGIYYPTNLTEQFAEQHQYFPAKLLEGDAEGVLTCLNELKRQAQLAGCHTAFLSAEEFCTLPEEQVSLFGQLSAMIFSERSYVFLVRNKADHLLSSYKHFLRFWDGPVDEFLFIREFKFFPTEAASAWSGSFSEERLVVPYDDWKNNLVATFYARVFDHVAVADMRENVAQDLITLAACNIFIKENPSIDIEKALWVVGQRHPRAIFSFESFLSASLTQHVDDKYWMVPDLQEHWEALLAIPQRQTSVDPLSICRKMIDVFTMLEKHFNGELDFSDY